jgi:hypothetical protein
VPSHNGLELAGSASGPGSGSNLLRNPRLGLRVNVEWRSFFCQIVGEYIFIIKFDRVLVCTQITF